MSLTQKYKQQQRQVRVHTNESNYLNGMYFSDVPLAEGYSRVLINYDIDSLSGKLTPRKGLQTLGLIKPEPNARQYLDNSIGFNTIVKSKVCAASDSVDARKINRHLQTILYNTDSRSLMVATCDPEVSADNQFKITPFSFDAADEYVAPEPFVIPNPGIHNKLCAHNNFFKRPVGTFAFGNSFYTFLRHSRYSATKLADLPNDNYKNKDGENISTFVDLKDNSNYSTGTPGQYFVFIAGESMGIIAYYDVNGELQQWLKSEEALKREEFVDLKESNSLCYTKIGSDLQDDDVLLDSSILLEDIDPDKYYVCVAKPERLNPTEASSWGYNMLLEDPYDFVCEDTAVNLITILGMLPYNKDGKITLTPKKNQEITLKGFYRAPQEYHSDAQNARFYATTKKTVEVITTETVLVTNTDAQGRTTYTDGTHTVYFGYIITAGSSLQRYYYVDENGNSVVVDENTLLTTEQEVSEIRDPKSKTELENIVIDLTNYNFGDWWFCTDENTYYMVMPADSLTTKKLALFGTTQPAASEKLNALPSGEENEIRVRWQLRSAGASDWIDLYNEKFKLSEYYERQGNLAPFTVTTTMPDSEVLVKLTITDPNDIVSNEEYVLSTNTIGLSLVSDELANTLNLDAKNFDLGQCTGMCEWEQRLVVWGVPGALNTIFISDVGNPTFFPYPNNVDIFTDPIISVHNYGNELLVLTTSALYRLIWDTEGTGWSHKLVQQNLHVTEADTYMSCVIKNMFFFKSGEYYYMMVPKTTAASSVRGEVAIAPISKPIEGLLDNFHEEVYNLIKVMVDFPDLGDFTNQLVNYFSYVDNTKVVVNYVYDLNATIGNVESVTDSKYLYVQLIYDTDARTWAIRAFEAAHMLYASHADAIQQDRFIDLTPALDGDQLVLQYYKFVNSADDSIQYVTETGAAQAATKTVKNYQYLDTGNREINTELKKRFREFQFKIKNNTATNLGFYTSFLVDGSLRKDLQRYSPRFILDSTTGEATIVVERVLDPATMAYNTTRIERVLIPERMLQDAGELTPTTLAEETDPDRWILDQSAFPGRTLWKIRMPISGKGLSPRVILLSTNEQDFEILGHSFVYRTMNAR